ncbi:MAG: DUF3795 domain-containing protein [Candidatus Hodarchaeota archaeon]
MKDLYSKCGCNCGRCALYTTNLRTAEDRQRAAAGMKYLGWNPTPEKLRKCSGCQSTKGYHYNKNCRVRLCAMKSGFENCAYCSAFPCAEVPTVSFANPEEYRTQRENKMGKPIPEEDYAAYIEVYAGLRNLERIRSSLNQDEVTQVQRIPYSPRIVELPTDLGFSQVKNESYTKLYKILTEMRKSSMDLEDTNLFAVQQRLKKRAENVFRFLFLLGNHGRLVLKPKPRIIIDSVTYYGNKKGSIPGSEREMDIVFKILANHGFTPDLVPLIEDQWKTDAGHLRDKERKGTRPVWQVELAADKTTLKTLKEYVSDIHSKLGSRAYAAFSKVDMRSISK